MKAHISRAIATLGASLLGLGVIGCGPEFDPPTELTSLRIMGVQKDKPYVAPGDQVKFTMLWHDGSPQAGAKDRQVNIMWLDACVNPPGDSYAACFEQIGVKGKCYQDALASGGDTEACGFHLGTGPEYTLAFPAGGEPWLGGKPVLHPNQDPKWPDYAVGYVFFALCAGTPSIEPTGIACRDADGKLLDSDDAVIGYSAVYSFAQTTLGQPRSEPYLNGNPVMTGFKISHEEVSDVTCIDADCLGTCADGDCENRPPTDPVDCDTHPGLCVAACKDDGDIEKCPAIGLMPLIDTELTVENDDVTNGAYGRGFLEQQWIDYYSTRGRFRSATKLLNDATTGLNAKYYTDFFAPKAKGPVQVWAVVHDNRGGQAWAGITIQVQ
jgi:hypothetical protein